MAIRNLKRSLILLISLGVLMAVLGVLQRRTGGLVGSTAAEKVLAVVPQEYFGFSGGVSSDGKFRPQYVFSPDGQHVAYIASREDVGAEKSFVVVDGVPGKSYSYVPYLAFSPDSREVAYGAVTDHGYVAVHGSVEGPSYEAIKDLSFTPEGALIYSARKGNRWVLVEGGKEVTPPILADDGLFFFHPSTRRVVAVTREGERFLVADGQTRKSIEGFITNFVFSADGQHYAYVFGDGRGSVIVHDGQERVWPSSVIADSLGIRADGKQVAFAAHRQPGLEKAYAVVVGDDVGRTYDFIYGDIVFSPDGSRHAYVASKEGAGFLVVDEEEFQLQWHTGITSTTVFSPDASIAAVVTGVVNSQRLESNGSWRGKKSYDEIWQPSFSADGKVLSYGALSGREFLWVQEHLK